MGEYVKLCGKVGPRGTVCAALDTHVGHHAYVNAEFASAAPRMEALLRRLGELDVNDDDVARAVDGDVIAAARGARALLAELDAAKGGGRG